MRRGVRRIIDLRNDLIHSSTSALPVKSQWLRYETAMRLAEKFVFTRRCRHGGYCVIATDIYYDPGGPELQRGFRCIAEAWWVDPRSDRPWDEHFGLLSIPEPLYQALFCLKIVDDLAALPHEFILGAYEEGILRNDGLPEASTILRSAAQDLDETYDWLVATTWEGSDEISFRISVDGPELREGLVGLAAFMEEGARRGYDVQLWL